jgi:protein SCO1/2
MKRMIERRTVLVLATVLGAAPISAAPIWAAPIWAAPIWAAPIWAAPIWAAAYPATLEHSARGIVLESTPALHSLIVSCEAIPGYMDPMEMSFAVQDSKALESLKPGTTISFKIVQRGGALYADNIHAETAANLESEPMEAGGLTALRGALNPSAAKVVAIGQMVPDFALTDQTGKIVHLHQLGGKVVALTFGYSRCPNPNYCVRLSNNLAGLEKRFHEQAGRDLVLVTIAIDPEHDQGAALADYAAGWKADPAAWHFLTGPLPEVKQVSGMFGMDFWRDEGSLTHSLHTVIIDRQGRLAANLEGNQFSAEQLGDLVQTVMNRPP